MERQTDHPLASRRHGSGDAELMKAVANVAKILLEMAECEADDGNFLPLAPGRSLHVSLGGLAEHFRTIVVTADIDARLQVITECDPQFAREADVLRTEREVLANMLEDVSELAGSGHRPTTSWSWIESQFSKFTRALVHHLARKRALFDMALGEDGDVHDPLPTG